MKKIIYRLVLLAPLFAVKSASAQVSIDFPTGFAGFSSQELKVTIQNIVRIIVGFLGIIVVILFLYGGFLWFTSFGEEDKIEKAKKLIVTAVVGLIIILTAYAIASFVINSLQNAV